tara:strand:+ start:576 stop:1298 length:723 start_codon:yes stop_codon:yes gene_type:complete
MKGLDVSVKTNIRSVTKRVKKFQGVDLPKAVGFAMNDTARKMMKLYNMNTNRTFNKPVKYTSSAFGFTKTSSSQKTVNDKIAYVGVKGEPNIKSSGDSSGTNRRIKYMRLQTDGGERTPNRKYIVIPTVHSELNQHGNFPRNFVKRVKADKKRYFFGTPKGRPSNGSFNGIWRRLGTTTNDRSPKLQKVASFIDRQTINKLFPFDKLTRTFIPKILEKQLQKQIRFQFNKKFKSKLVKVR